jgi:hypothetical protein
MQRRCAHRLLLLQLLTVLPCSCPCPPGRQSATALGVAQTFPQHLLLLHCQLCRRLLRRLHCRLRSQHGNGRRRLVGLAAGCWHICRPELRRPTAGTAAASTAARHTQSSHPHTTCFVRHFPVLSSHIRFDHRFVAPLVFTKQPWRPTQVLAKVLAAQQ